MCVENSTMNIRDKIFHIIFWISIGFLCSILLLFYLVRTNNGLLPSVIPLITIVIQIVVAEKIKKKNKYYPTSAFGFILINISFLLFFLGTLFYLNNDFLMIKIGMFILMSILGIYTSYFLLTSQSSK